MLYPAELLRQVTVAIIPVFRPDCKCPLQFCARFLILQDGHEPLHGFRLRGNLRQYRTIPALRLKHRSGGCGTSLAVSALRIMRYCLNILKAAEKVGNKKSNRPEAVGDLYRTHFENRSSPLPILCDTAKKKSCGNIFAAAFWWELVDSQAAV